MNWKSLASQILNDDSSFDLQHRLEKELEYAYNTGLADRELEIGAGDSNNRKTAEVEKVEVRIQVCTKSDDDDALVSKRLETITLDPTSFSCRQSRQYETIRSSTGEPIDHTPIGNPHLVLQGVVKETHASVITPRIKLTNLTDTKITVGSHISIFPHRSVIIDNDSPNRVPGVLNVRGIDLKEIRELETAGALKVKVILPKEETSWRWSWDDVASV